MKKIFIVKEKNILENTEKTLTTMAFKDYNYALEYLREHLIDDRYDLQQEKYDLSTDMTEILKGVIEVYETKKGQFCEIFGKEPIKTYNYNF